MNIRHIETGIDFQITEETDRWKLGLSTGKTYTFKHNYDAIWFVIESIRNSALDAVDEEMVRTIARRWHLNLPDELAGVFLAAIKKEKIHRNHYDQLFLRLISQQRNQQVIEVSSRSNLMIDHEIAFFIRTSVPSGSPVSNPV